MNVDAIRAFCMSLPRTSEKLQWGDNLCFKVAGKIFAILSLDDPRLCFKCSPDTFAELIELEDIQPAPYVGRYKWVMLDRLDVVRWNELENLIRLSYDMVLAKAPKNTQRAGQKRAGSKSGSAKRRSKSGRRKQR